MDLNWQNGGERKEEGGPSGPSGNKSARLAALQYNDSERIPRNLKSRCFAIPLSLSNLRIFT